MRLVFGDAELAGAGRLSAADPDQPHPALRRLFLRPESASAWSASRPGILAEDGEVARRWPVWLGLCARCSTARSCSWFTPVTTGLWIWTSRRYRWKVGCEPAFALYSARNDVHRAVRVLRLSPIAHEAARRHVALRPTASLCALRLHHLAAIRQSTMQHGRRSSSSPLCSAARLALSWGLGAAAENSCSGADDFKLVPDGFEWRETMRALHGDA